MVLLLLLDKVPAVMGLRLKASLRLLFLLALLIGLIVITENLVLMKKPEQATSEKYVSIVSVIEPLSVTPDPGTFFEGVSSFSVIEDFTLAKATQLSSKHPITYKNLREVLKDLW